MGAAHSCTQLWGVFLLEMPKGNGAGSVAAEIAASVRVSAGHKGPLRLGKLRQRNKRTVGSGDALGCGEAVDAANLWAGNSGCL